MSDADRPRTLRLFDAAHWPLGATPLAAPRSNGKVRLREPAGYLPAGQSLGTAIGTALGACPGAGVRGRFLERFCRK